MARRHSILPLAAALSLALVPAAAGAPSVTGEFAVSETPGQLALGPDGNVWVALQGVAKDVARITPGGTVTEFEVSGVGSPVGITAGPDGNLWVTQAGGVVRFSPAAPETGTPFAVAAIADARRITAGPDGNLWTASGDNVVRITPAGVAKAFPVAGMGARGIARGADGRLYVADFAGARLVGLTAADPPVVTFHDVGGGPQEVATGTSPELPVAFANPGADPHHAGLLKAAGGALTAAMPLTDPFGLALGLDGAHWVARFASHDLARLAADGTAAPLGGLSANSGPRFVTAGAGGTLWVSLETVSKVARVSGLEAPPPPDPGPTDPGPTDPGPTDPGPTDPGPPAADTTAPAVSGLELARRARRGRRPAFSLSLSEAAELRVRLERRRAGRRKGGRCVAQRKARRGARRCRRWVRVAAEKQALPAGEATLVLAGKLRATGRHRIRIVARDAAGNAAPPVRLAFRARQRSAAGQAMR